MVEQNLRKTNREFTLNRLIQYNFNKNLEPLCLSEEAKDYYTLSDEERQAVYKQFSNPFVYQNCEVDTKALDVVGKLAAAGVDVEFHSLSYTTEIAVIKWDRLKENLQGVSHWCYVPVVTKTNTKNTQEDELRVCDYVIDDNPEELMQYLERGKCQCYLVEHYYNQLAFYPELAKYLRDGRLHLRSTTSQALEDILAEVLLNESL
jgi:predicted house-cleaning noncanonical NTP pyrophosphatase (MazG superfamily)